MKLSEHTISVLKNFASINQNLVIKEGSELQTMSAMKNIVSKATVEESFPKEFAIYDLNEFLASLSLFKDPILTFDEQSLEMKEEKNHFNALRYFYSDPSVVQSPSNTITMPSEEVSFELTNETLSKMKRASAVIGAPDMVLERNDTMISKLRAKDKKIHQHYKGLSAAVVKESFGLNDNFMKPEPDKYPQASRSASGLVAD